MVRDIFFIYLIFGITLALRLCYMCLFCFSIAGERVVGRGSELYQLCKDIDDTIKGTFVYYCYIIMT